MSEEAHFSPLVEGVKLLPNPLIFRFFFLKFKILLVFCLFLFQYYVGKDNLHSCEC